MMRVALVGNLRPEHSTENDLLKSLRILGHEVTIYQEDAKDGHKGCYPDVVIWCHTHGWDVVDWRNQWPGGIPVVAFTLDLFRGLARHDPDYVKKHPWFTCDYFFQPDEPDYLRSLGVNALFSAPGILETSAYAAAPNPLHPAYGKIVFVGSRSYHPEWPWRGQLLEFLEKEYKGEFIHYDHSSGMRGHALNELYASAAVVVGDSALASPESRYTSDRLYESLGRGANLVYPNMKMPLAIRACLLTYDPEDTGGLKFTIDVALNARTVMTTLPASSVSVVRREHTYTHRLRAILAQVKP